MDKTEITDRNRVRAASAKETLTAYDQDGEDACTGLIDLLTNTIHLLGPKAVLKAVAMAATHYNAELVSE